MRKSLLNIDNLPDINPMSKLERELLDQKVDIDEKYNLPSRNYYL